MGGVTFIIYLIKYKYFHFFIYEKTGERNWILRNARVPKRFPKFFPNADVSIVCLVIFDKTRHTYICAHKLKHVKYCIISFEKIFEIKFGLPCITHS